MPTDLHQEGKICRGNRELRNWLNRHKTCELWDMDLVGAKCHGWLESECTLWQEIDRAGSPGLSGKSRSADGEDIVWTVQCTCFIGKANTGIGDRRYTLAINDGKEHRPQAVRCGIDGFLIAKFAEVI